MQKFQLGDVVLFKSASPPMVVVDYFPLLQVDRQTIGASATVGKYKLTWFSEDKNNEIIVSEDALISLEEYKSHVRRVAEVAGLNLNDLIKS